MIKKVTAAAGIILLPMALLTGCSSKLSAADTCSYITDHARESGLDQRLVQSNKAIRSGDYAAAVVPFADYAKLLNEAAEQSDDRNLAESIRDIATWTNNVSIVFGDEALDSESKAQKSSSLAADIKLQDHSTYLRSVCPDL